MIMNPTAIKHVVVDGHSLTLESFVAIARYNATVELAPSALEAMKKSRALAEKIAAEGRVAYGITTGFGEFQKVAVPKEMSNQLSTNLILSHCTAAGEPYADEIVRGMMLLRANALCGGVSGVRPILVEMLLEMLNKGVTPVVPQKGSLGSSGDLAPLAHMTLPMLGKGEAMYEGVKMPGAEAMAKAGDADLDLVKISPNAVPPVCKLMDYGKYRFEQTKRDKEAKKNQRIVEIKEVRMSPGIDVNDFNVKVRNAQRFLADGNRVKVAVRFRGREMAHTDIGKRLLEKFAADCAEVATMDKEPKLDGRHMTMFLSCRQNKETKK